MIELPLLTSQMIRDMIENFTIIATLVFLYNFVPDIFVLRTKRAHSLLVGIIFGLAAVISIPAFWQSTDVIAIGFNFILIPLSGFIGGPISSTFVAAVLLGGSAASGGTLSFLDISLVMCGILLGALFYSVRSSPRFPASPYAQLALLGFGIVLVQMSIFAIFDFLHNFPGLQFNFQQSLPLLPYFIISWAGTIIVGSIINYIDRKNEAEHELFEYKNHLENLVKERTLELRHANSLQKATIESTADAIIVVDREGLIRAYNQKASHILHLPLHMPVESETYGIFIEKICPFLSNPDEFKKTISPLSESAEQFVTKNQKFNDGRIFEIFIHPQQVGDQIIGRVWSLNDVTEERHAKEAIDAVNNKLILLSNITRHDVFNQMTALFAYLEMLEMDNPDPKNSKNINAMKKSLGVIHDQLEFTRDYENIGLKKPEWQDAGLAFIRAAGSFSGKNIVFSCETRHVEIFTDPMIGQVFYNLIDNSLRHGGKVSEIRLSVQLDEPDLLLVYEDNGTGILPDDKEKIFVKGFGKHTGLGMFLIREILSITGITIRECGIWQQGVRFEIRVPRGKFRFP